MSPTTPATSAPADTSAASATGSNGVSMDAFLQLLVSEIKNQDPTAPMDSTTFLTQLAQFSQLEQMSGIRQDIETGTYDAPTGTASTAPASTANTTTPASASTDAALANATAASTSANLANTAQQNLTNTALTSGL